MKFAATSVINAPVIGMAVRLTTSNGETPPILEATTMTAVIGDMALAALAAKCMGSNMTTGATDILAATVGVSAAKAKNGALPDPMRTDETAIIVIMTMIMPAAPNPDVWADRMMESIVPIVTRPLAKVSPATIKVMTFAICIPSPS